MLEDSLLWRKALGQPGNGARIALRHGIRSCESSYARKSHIQN
jgi:hypothetical protein